MEFNEEIQSIVDKVKNSIMEAYKFPRLSAKERGIFLLYVEYLEETIKTQELLDKYQTFMNDLIAHKD